MSDEFEEPVIQIDAQEFTDTERQLILQVVARDEDIRLQEKSRLDNLKVELRQLKEKGVPDGEEESYGRVCKRCRTPLGLIFNSGAFCPTCGHKVCKLCRIPLEKPIIDDPINPWTCTICSMFRDIRAESGAWFYSDPDQPTAKKKKVYGSMLMKRIFSIARKRDTVIYKDPVWNEIIQEDELEEIDDDQDDYLLIASEMDGENTLCEGNNSSETSIKHVLGDSGADHSSLNANTHQKSSIDDSKPLSLADLANTYASNGILDTDSCIGSEITSPVQNYSEPSDLGEKEIVIADNGAEKIGIYYTPDMENSSSSEDEGVYSHHETLYEHPDEKLYENGVNNIAEDTGNKEIEHLDELHVRENEEKDVTMETNVHHIPKVVLEVDDYTEDSAQKNGDEACSSIKVDENNASNDQGHENIHQLVEGDIPGFEKNIHEELDIEPQTEVSNEIEEIYDIESSISSKDVSGITEELLLGQSQEHLEDIVESELCSVHVQPKERIILDVDSNITMDDKQAAKKDMEFDIEVSEPCVNVSLELNVSSDLEEPDNLFEEKIHNVESNNRSIGMDGKMIIKEELFVSQDFQEVEFVSSIADIEVPLKLESPVISEETDKCAEGQILDVQSSIMIREEKENRIDDNLQKVDSAELIEPSADLKPTPINVVGADINHKNDIINSTTIYLDNAPKQVDTVSEPINEKLANFGENMIVDLPSINIMNVSDEIVLEEENASTAVPANLSGEEACIVTDTYIKESANLEENTSHDNEGGLLGNVPGVEVHKPKVNGHVENQEEDIDDIVNNFKTTQEIENAETASIFSDHSEDGDARPLKTLAGEVQIGLKYDHNDSVFEIQVHRAKDLPPADLAKVTADPYVKVYLTSTIRSLGKRKTKAKKNSLTPEFDEVLSFNIEHEELITSICNISVWHYEFSNNNIPLGDVDINIEEFLNSGFSLESPIPQWYTLHSKKLNFTQLTFCGEMILNLQYKAPGSLVADTKREQRKLPNPTKGQLHINIIQAKGLKTEEDTFYCKISLVLTEKDKRRKKSKFVSGTTDPYWDEDFIIDNISWAQLETSYLQIAVRGKQKNSVFIAGARLGLGKSKHLKHDSFGEEVRAWQSMLDHTNEPQDFCIPLRDNLDSIKQDVAVPPRQVKEITDEEYDKKKMKKDSTSSSSLAKRFLNADALSLASTGSMLSIYSNAGGQSGNLVITGEILFSMKHDMNSNVFSILLEKAKGIAAANAKQQTSDPYCKIYLFPDKTKSTKKKTSHRRKTVNPMWKETVKYTISRDELLKKTLQVSIWNHDRFGRNDFLGEVQVNLKHYSSTNNLDTDPPVWYTLQEMAPISIGAAGENKGELKVGVRFDHEVLNIVIKQANGLYAVNPEVLPNPFVKCYLLPDKSRKSKRKTAVQKKTIAPVWNEKFDYKNIQINDLYSRVLEVTVWDHNSSGHQFLGGLRLGLPHGDEYWHDCFGKEVSAWEAMMKHLGILAEYAIPLRATMTSRKGQITQELPMITAITEDKEPIISMSSDYSAEGSLVRISLQYLEAPVDDAKKKKKKAKGSLKVHLKEAKNLPVKYEEDVPSTFCKGFIHPKKKSAKMKTETYIKSANPLWDTEMLFEGVTLDELRSRALEIVVYDEISEKKKEVVGYIRLGSGGNTEKWDDSTGVEVDIWRSMLNNPTQSVMKAVPLRITQELLPEIDYIEDEDESNYDDSRSLNEEKEDDETGQAGSESPRTAALRAMGVHAANVVGLMSEEGASIAGGPEDTVLTPIVEESEAYASEIPITEFAPSFMHEEEIKPGDPPFPGAGMDKDDDDIEEEYKFKQKKKQPPSFSLLKKSMSQESLSSIYSTDSANIYGQVPIRGEIQFGMKYDYAASTFEVHIFQAKDIAAVDTKKEISDPYCKVYLLPDKTKSGKRKTTTRKKTLQPEWEEILEFKISLRDLRTRTLWLALWHLERFGRNIFLGEVMMNMDTLIDGTIDLETSTPKWYTLSEKGQAPTTNLYKGEIKFSIIFEDQSIFGKQTPNRGGDNASTKKKKKKKENKGTGKINVHIKECHDLPAADRDGYSDPFCKCYLLPLKSSKTKRKTPVIRHTRNPVWDYKFEYQCDYEDLADHGIEFGVWDWDRSSRNDFLGCCRINLGTRMYNWDDAEGVEVESWQHLIDHPNVWKEFLIPLRSKLDTRGDAFDVN